MTYYPIDDLHIRLADYLKTIADTSSKNAKEDFVRVHKDVTYFVNVLDFLLNDFVVSGLAVKKINKTVTAEAMKNIQNINNMLDYLKENSTGTDQDIAEVQYFLNTLPNEEVYDIFKGLLTKTLKIGMSVKTANKALGNIIPEFNCQLAHPYAKYEKKVNDDFFITQKLDGHRVLAKVGKDSVTFFTRKGHVVEGLTEVEKAILGAGFREVMLDGEMIHSNAEELKDKAFQETGKILKKDGEKHDLTYHVFDIISTEEFEFDKCTMPYYIRRSYLDNVANNMKPKEALEIVPTLYWGTDKSKLPEMLQAANDKGWEGLMLNTADGVYKCKRSSDILKLKTFFSSDVLVLDAYEGTQKYEGMLGGITIQFKDFTVNVGSGFTDEQRKYYWDHKDEIIGKVIEVQYFEETENQKEGKSLRFPTFKGVREDKTVADISYES